MSGTNYSRALPCRVLLFLLIMLSGRFAEAQPSDAGIPPDSGTEIPSPSPKNPDTNPPAEQIERPRLVRNVEPVYPVKAWQADREAEVVVLLTIDTSGAVTEAALVQAVGHGFDESALGAAHQLEFSPATVNGTPVVVQIRFTFRFEKPEKPTRAQLPTVAAATNTDKRKPGTIKATVYERGKGKKLANIEVYVLDQDKVVLTDKNGQFQHTGPPGAYAFTIRPPGFYPFKATERVKPGETVKVKYYIRRRRNARYQTIVWGGEGRAEVGRTSLKEDEIRSVAGTMGDPVRVVSLLPGAASSVSGLGYPIVRGSLPGDSLYEIDGIQIPMLYHLLFGPAVVHPRFVDEIVFQPGGYSAKHGRFPGARIGATAARVGDDPIWVADLSIVQTSLFRSQKFADKDGEVLAAVRYGTLGYIIEGLASNIVFRYWDYQTRIGYRLPNEGKLTLTVLGASDTAGESDPFDDSEEVLRVGFHTADIRYQHGFGKSWLKAGAQFSHEFFKPPAGELDDEIFTDTSMQGVRPYLQGGYVSGDLELSAGLDVHYQDFGLQLNDNRFTPADTGRSVGLWTAAEWTIGKFLIAPSMRVDNYSYNVPAGPFRGASTQNESSANPRLSLSYGLTSRILLKTSIGEHSGPSRFSFSEPPIVFGPVPAFEGLGLQYGLQSTKQVQAGIETKVTDDLEFNLTGFFNSNTIPVDFSLLNKDLATDPIPCGGGGVPEFNSPFDVKGRSYGAEFLLRQRLGKSVFGWASYAVSKAERDVDGIGTLPFDFDQRHVFNGVLSWDVGRNWTLGGVFHYNTGRPYTPTIIDRCGNDGFGEIFSERRGEPNSERLPNYWRIDVRIQKREVYETWFFDFYIDFFNASFQFETVDFEQDFDSNNGELKPVTVPLFVPTIGIRGEF